ncbi:MAG: hypothetical protein JWO10_1600, partial [Microbacteriaceae bacterium]|nr:hypothetical protein [Microbacteriaceae bacterium]
MTSLGAKLGALGVAGAIIATTALPAYADLGPATVAEADSVTVQSVSLTSSVAVLAASRDTYGVTFEAPKPKAVVLPNKYTGASPPNQSFSGSAVLAYAAQCVGVVPYGSGNCPES